jgi:3-oxoacyl-[acyl-carrier protein] reductase
MNTLNIPMAVRNRLANFSFANDTNESTPSTAVRNRSLLGRVALVSGGGSGISRAIATELARRGASVALVHDDRSRAAEAQCDAMQELGSKVMTIQRDITVESECANAIESVFDELGVVDILVHFADFRTETPIHLLHRKDWDQVVHSGLGGAYNLTRALINPMRQHGGGRIVFVVEAPWRENRCQYGQVMTGESAINGLARALAMENASRGITVNSISTGIFESTRTIELSPKERERMTAMVPSARMGKPEEAAHIVAFLVSDDAAYVTGQCIAVDGGLSI